MMATDSTEIQDDSATRPVVKPSGRRGFSMSVINFWVDLVLLLIVTFLGWISATLRFVFPAPTTAAGWTLWGWNYDQWADFQFSSLCVLAVGVVVHLMLHWNWVCSVIANHIVHTKRPDDSMQTIYGVGALIVLLHIIAAGLIAAMWSLKHPPG